MYTGQEVGAYFFVNCLNRLILVKQTLEYVSLKLVGSTKLRWSACYLTNVKSQEESYV